MMKTIEESCIFQKQNQSILHDCSSDWVKLHENLENPQIVRIFQRQFAPLVY